MRKLMTTTALVAVLAVPGFAISGPAFAASAGHNGAIVTVTTIGKADASGYLASNLMGRKVYESSAKDAKSIGDVEDVLLSEGGQAQAVIIGVGGFLGVGEKRVAIDFDRLTMEKAENGDLRVVSAVTKTELETAASYEKHSMGETVTKTVDQASKSIDQATAAVTGAAASATDNVADRKAFLEGKTKVAMGSVSTDKLVGAPVYDRNWNHVGEVGELVVKADGRPDAAIIDVGGFLGIGEKPVALGYDAVEVYQDQSGDLYVATPYSEKELEEAVEFDAEAYKTDRTRFLLVPRNG